MRRRRRRDRAAEATGFDLEARLRSGGEGEIAWRRRLGSIQKQGGEAEAKASTFRLGSSKMGLRQHDQIDNGFERRDQIDGAVD